jgi:hypothetical protein
MRTVNVYLTTHAIDYLYHEFVDIDADKIGDDAVITQIDECGGLFIERASTVSEEGSGVWVDASGQESQGPSDTFVESVEAQQFHEKTDMPADA